MRRIRCPANGHERPDPPFRDAARDHTSRHAVGVDRIVFTHRHPEGECGAREGLTGYYFREARFLRTLRLTVDGERLWLCEGSSVSPAVLSFTYVYPEIAESAASLEPSAADGRWR